MHLEKPTETTRFILERLQNPESLDNHPWTRSTFVKEYLSRHLEARDLSAGHQMAGAVAELFLEGIPSSPPRKGKRLDNRWGEYGLLAAQYTVPYLSGTARPRSLREAWSGIDQAIYFLVSRTQGNDDPQLLAEYALIANESDVANSTISDWHRKGLERFAEQIVLREKHIETEATKKIESKQQIPQKRPHFGRFWGVLGLVLFLLLAAGAGWGYIKAQRLIGIAKVLRDELQNIQKIEPSLATLQNPEPIRQSLAEIDTNLQALDAESRDYLWLTKNLGWIPTYGGDLQNSEALLDMALALNACLQATYEGYSPLLDSLGNTDNIDISRIVKNINQAEPHLKKALQSLAVAQQKRAEVDATSLSPTIRELLEEKIDPRLIQLDQALKIASALPNLLGTGSGGPKTYMVILQNEDELRATGGFLTAVGSLVVRDGEIITMVIESSDEVDDLSKTYSSPPWQLEAYMDASIYLLRDSNWSPDFPTTAAWVEYLYAYTRAHSVDGIIAFNQHAIVKILETVGPVNVEGQPAPITAENVIETIRKSKTPPEGETHPEWHRKDFLSSLAQPMMEKILSGQGFTWTALSQTLVTLMDEKHILLQFDDEDLASLLTLQDWDGRVTPFEGDYLMIIDSNIGFSKNNAIVKQSIDLEIDLRVLAEPRKKVKITYTNPTQTADECGKPAPLSEKYYPINRCYSNYLRIYTPQGSILTAATPHEVPAEWTTLRTFVPARVDTLTDDVEGFAVFGTYFVVPMQQTLSTSFYLQTPPEVILTQREGEISYRLKIQKQPGTIALPVSFRMQLPEGAEVLQMPAYLSNQNGVLQGQFTLREDVLIEIVFSELK